MIRLMDQNNPPATPLSSDTSQPQSFVVPDVSTQPANFRTPDSSKLKMFLMIGGVVFILGVGGGVFYLAPKIETRQFASTLKPQVNSLKDSAALVKASVNAIHYEITSDTNASSNNSLQSSQLLIHPQIADLLVGSDVLGASTKKLGLLESTVLDIQEQVTGKLGSLVENENVAADSSSADNPSNARFRMVKDETQKASSNITKAQTDFNSLSSDISNHPIFLTSQAKNQVVGDQTLNTDIKPYFDQAQKISSYYQNLSDMIINMNTKITSFKTSLSSTSTTFSQLKNPNLTQVQVEGILAQSQVFLDQAKQDTSDIKDLTQNLKNMPADSLPDSADKYQAHNIQVLQTVGDYFDSESTIMQGFIDNTNALLTKSQTGTLTKTDSLNYLTEISTGGQKAALADTKFVSDLNTLTGEETPLTLSFWQDNGILNKADTVETDINHLQQNINSL